MDESFEPLTDEQIRKEAAEIAANLIYSAVVSRMDKLIDCHPESKKKVQGELFKLIEELKKRA